VNPTARDALIAATVEKGMRDAADLLAAAILVAGDMTTDGAARRIVELRRDLDRRRLAVARGES
jgi:hypothetical protein